MIELRLQLRIDADTRVGPGKVRLLEKIGEAGSISAAAREMGMTYRRAWELVDHMNKAFGQPLIVGHTGSTGGADLTELGRTVVDRFRRIEAAATAAAADHLTTLSSLIVAPVGRDGSQTDSTKA